MTKFFPTLFLLLVFTADLCIGTFDKVVIWGHKLHSHTHSYIHGAFFAGFQHLGYCTYWLDNETAPVDFDYANTLFLTEGQVDQNIPLRSDCIYLVHNPGCPSKYRDLQTAFFQVYTDDVLAYPSFEKVGPCIYFDLQGKCLYMPWATDLLPNEIEVIKSNLATVQQSRSIFWIGTVGDGRFGNREELLPFINACNENGIPFIAKNSSGTGISQKEHIQLISSSYMAPAIVGSWQKEVGYIPCRIFKNISYGQMGITNSYRVYELFEGKIIYNSDSYQLFYDAQERLAQLHPDELVSLVEFVQTKHTYLNRIHTMLDFLQRLGFIEN